MEDGVDEIKTSTSWEPDPKTIVKLYKRLEEEKVLEVSWKPLGRCTLEGVHERELKRRESGLKAEAFFTTTETVVNVESKPSKETFDFDSQDSELPVAMKTISRTPVSQPRVKQSSLTHALSDLYRHSRMDSELEKQAVAKTPKT